MVRGRGEPLIDYDDDMNSDQEPDEQLQWQQHHLLDDDDENDWWNRRERSPSTPVHDDYKLKLRKRPIKKSSAASESASDFRLRDEDDGDFGVGEEDDVSGLVKDESEEGGGSSSSFGGRSGGKRKRLGKESGGVERGKKEKRREGKGEKKYKAIKPGYSREGRSRDHEGDREMKEMCDTIAGGDSKDDREGVRTLDDDNFIDDTVVDPVDRYGSDREHSPGDAPQAEEGEEDEEIKQLFKMGKKKKKNEKSAGEIALLVENVMVELEVVAEEDAELNRQSKLAINKLKKLHLLTEVLSK